MQVIGIIGSSGSGKTTLIAALLPLLKKRGLRVSTVKHAHHGFDMDRPGKDSYIHREAGAEEVMVASSGRWVLLREEPQTQTLSQLLSYMSCVDLVLVEGFKTESIPKIEVYRPSLGKAPFYPETAGIIAIASDETLVSCGRALLSLNAPEKIADFIFTLRDRRAA